MEDFFFFNFHYLKVKNVCYAKLLMTSILYETTEFPLSLNEEYKQRKINGRRG